MEVTRKTLILGIVAAAAVCVMVYSAVRAFTSEETQRAKFHKKREAYRTPLQCTACGHTFTLTTPEQREAMLAAGDQNIGSPGGTGFKCPKCGGHTAYTAYYCDECDLWYPLTSENEGHATCPKCGAWPVRHPPKDKLPHGTP